jgi:amino acid adenylation domain-containing protein
MTNDGASIEELSPAERERVVAALRREAVAAADDAIPRRSGRAPAAASATQRRLWLLDRLRPGESAYNEPVAWRLRGVLDVALLERCLSEIVRRHEVLRTTFSTASDDEPIQVVHSPRGVALPILDLTRLPTEEREAEASRLAAQEARRPFDLVEGPLLRTSLLRLDEQEHVLVVVVHHIVADGWSIGLFRNELLDLYAAFGAGRPSPLPELPIQYADFAAWQRGRLRDADLDAQLEYWRRQLDGLPPLLELPIARARPQVETFAGAREPFAPSPELSRRIAAVAREARVTPFMTVLAGLQAVLHRYTGERDIAVGAALSGREHPALEPLIGFFVNTVVMRGDVRGDATFRELLEQMREVALAAREHQDVPFERVVEALAPPRSAGRNPLFQVMLAADATPPRRPQPSGLELTPTAVSSGAAKYDLTLQLALGAEGSHGVWEYNRDLYAPEDVRRADGHLRTLLEAALADLDRPLATLPLLTREELETLHGAWNHTRTPFPRDRCIHELFEEQAARTPDAPAVLEDERATSYGELNRRANQLARRLRGEGVGREARIGVAMQPSVDMLVAVLGVLKAGAAYVPLDPEHPARRLATMLASAGVDQVLTHDAVASRLPAIDAPIVSIDRERAALDSRPDGDLERATSPDALAYVLFTSGSTGEPKGVMVEHANVVHSTTARGHVYDRPPARFLLLSPLSFDSSVAGIFWTLTTGGALVLPRLAHASDVPALCHAMSASRSTHLLCVPSLYALILDEAQAEELAALETVIVAGEPLRRRVVERHMEVACGVGLFNEYGLTEATVWSTVHRCVAGEREREAPVGRPIANTCAYVLDGDCQPVPIGVPGELYVGGAGVARGYLGWPDLTAERFVPDPFAAGAGERLCRTGDRARFRPDGTLQLLGRVDDQVKVRGCRVELGEVEAALLEHPAVDAALAAAPALGDGHRRLVAQVVASDASLAAEELRGFVAERLPAFAVPSQIAVVDALPRSTNGKLDRQALTVQPPGADAGSGAGSGEGSRLAQELCEIWRTTLGLDSVGLDDDFFQIGGDSLSVVRVHNRLRVLTDRDVAITDLFKHPTIGRLVAFLEGQ